MRVSFSQVFSFQNGAVSPLVPIHVNGITIGPGAAFGAGVQLGGVDLASIAGKDLEVEIQNGAYVLKGFYQ